MLQLPDTLRLIIESCVGLHYLMRMRYPGMQNTALDREDGDHDLIIGEWRQIAIMTDLGIVAGPNQATVQAKRQRDYLKLYFNSRADSVPW